MSEALIITAGGWVGGDWIGESREKQWRSPSILISLNPSGEEEGELEKRWHLWEHGEQAQRAENKRGRFSKTTWGGGDDANTHSMALCQL